MKAAVLILNNHTRRRRLTQKTFTEILCPRSSQPPLGQELLRSRVASLLYLPRRPYRQAADWRRAQTVINLRELQFRHVVKISPHNEKILRERGDILKAFRHSEGINL